MERKENKGSRVSREQLDEGFAALRQAFERDPVGTTRELLDKAGLPPMSEAGLAEFGDAIRAEKEGGPQHAQIFRVADKQRKKADNK